jgi:MFS family permease
MIAMKFTIELDIGLSVLLLAALPQLVTDRETKLIVVGGPSDRTAIADAALRSRKRNGQRPSWGARRRVSQKPIARTIDAYILVLASLLMVAGSTADRLGRRRTFQTGLVVFTAGSLLCSLAPGLGWLIAFRMVHAVGASMLNPVAMSIITNVFTEPRERSRAIGAWGGVVGISLGLGLVVGGVLVETVGWRSIFWINIPIGMAAIALTACFVPESRAPRARRVDAVGQMLVIVALASVTYAIIEAPQAEWICRQDCARCRWL